MAKHKAKALEKEKKDEEKKELIVSVEEDINNIMSNTSFEELGVCSEICEAIKGMGYKHPTKI